MACLDQMTGKELIKTSEEKKNLDYTKEECIRASDSITVLRLVSTSIYYGRSAMSMVQSAVVLSGKHFHRGFWSAHSWYICTL